MGLFSDLTDFLFGWLMPEQPKPDLGIDVTKADTDAYIPVGYGRCYGGGLIVYQATNDIDNDDVKNDLLHQVVVWSEGICGGVVKNFVDDELSTSARFNAEAGFKWFYAVNMTNGLVGYSDPILNLSGKRGTDTFDGKLATYCRSEMTDGEVWSGQPNHKAEFNGVLIAAPTEIVGVTPEFIPSENPADQLFDLLKSPIYGKGLSSDFIDIGSFAASRAICETLVETYPASGVNRKLFTSNIILDTSNTVLDNVNTLLKAMRGWLFHSDGKLKLLIEKDDAPVDFNIDENDQGFIEFGEVKNSSKSNRYNRVVCRYTDPDSGWTKQEVIYPEPGSQEETDLLAEDNGVLLEKSISLDTCIYYHEAAHHAKTILQISREQLRTSVTWGPEAVILEVGDIVPVTRSALGWDGKLFRIETTEKSTQDGTVQLKLREHQPYIYDDANLGDKPVLPDTNIVYGTPAAPTNLVTTEVYNDFSQVTIDWDSTTTDHRVVIHDSLGKQILNTVIAGKSFSFSDYTTGVYSVKLYAIGGLGRQSASLDFDVTITAPPTPITAPTVTSKPGFITVEPPLPNATKYTYEWRWSTSEDATNIPGGKDTARTIADVIPDVTYAIEYRLVTPYGLGAWELVLVNGVEKSTYIWYVYADDNVGTNLSLDPTGKAYFGIVGGKASPTFDVNTVDPTIFDYYVQPDGGTTVGDGITTTLTKENIFINTASDGTGGVFDSTTATTFKVLAGSSDDTANWTISATDSASVTGSLAGTTYTVTGLSADTGIITFSATRSGYPTLTKVVGVSKVKDGSHGANGATAFTLFNTANCLIDGNKVTKISGSADWNAGARSREKYVGATASFVPQNGTDRYMVGLNDNPEAGSGYTDIDYAIYTTAFGDVEIWENGSNTTVSIPYAAGDVFTLVYDGETVKYLKGGVEFRSVSAPANKAFGLDVSILTQGASVENLTFSASGLKGGDGYSPVKGIDYDDGDDGQSVASIAVYKRSASAPATPTGGSFNFGTKVVTPPSGWSTGLPAGSDPLYTSMSIASVIGTTGTDSSLVWGSPDFLAQNGTNGTSGTSSYQSTIFKRSTSTPATPTGGSYNFGTNTLTPPSGWTQAIPTGTNPVYAAQGNFSISGATGTDSTVTWTTPVKALENGSAGGNGDDGKSTYQFNAYKRSASAPSTPTGGSFNFGTNVATAPSGWSINIPSGTDPVYVTSTLASVIGDTGTDSSLSWSTPIILAQDGTNGDNGANAFTLVNTANCIVSGNTVTKVSGTTAWDAGARSKEKYVGAAISFSVPVTGNRCMVGFNNDPPALHGYNDMEYMIYLNGTTFEVWQGFNQTSTHGSYNANDLFSLVYDGETVKFYRNGGEFKSIAASPGLAFGLDVSILDVGTVIENLTFSSSGLKGDEGPVGTLNTYTTTGDLASLLPEEWATISTITVPAGTYDVIGSAIASGDYDAGASRNIQVKFTKNTTDVSFSSTVTSKSPSVSHAKNFTETLTGETTYTFQVFISGFITAGEADAYINVIEVQ